MQKLNDLLWVDEEELVTPDGLQYNCLQISCDVVPSTNCDVVVIATMCFTQAMHC